MESKPGIADFLEVNINMEKFNLFANTLSCTLAAHDRQLQQHTKELAQLRHTMEDRTTRLKGQIQYEKDRVDKKRKEDNVYFNGVMADTLKKYDDLMHESKVRLNSLEYTLSHQKNESQMMENIKEEVKEVWKGEMKEMEEEMNMIENQIKELENNLKKSIGTQDFLLKNVIEAFDNNKVKV